jgi:formate--tetrahydrofolate ligase
MKGGATGGGYSQVAPMVDINLHFTGDFSAIALSHNLLSALLDNHIYHGNELDIDVRYNAWRRVMDMNDRSLREIVCCLGGAHNGFPREDGFDIVVASEVMAIICLSRNLQDLKQRLGNIVVGYNRSRRPVRARDLQAQGAMTVLLKEALKPNLVQTLEGTPAFIHGGPFANIAHGCNSVLATASALRLADYVVTEAGFGADLGAEKFIDIKCRKAGLQPAAVVVVATLRALKYHGGLDVDQVHGEDLGALEAGIPNLERHLDNIQVHFGLPCVVAVNHRNHDTDAEFHLLQERLSALKVPVISARHWSQGGAGAEDLARAVVDLTQHTPRGFKFLYDDSLPLWDKLVSVAMKIYGASSVVADAAVLATIRNLQESGYGHYPICIAKTQYSFSTDPQLRGAPTGHVLNVREVRLAAGAEFIVMICGDVMTMPGLPRIPAANRMDVDELGKIVGLS